MSQNIGNIFVNILRFILELQGVLYYRVTRIIVNDFESENLYVVTSQTGTLYRSIDMINKII